MVIVTIRHDCIFLNYAIDYCIPYYIAIYTVLYRVYSNL